MAELHYHAPADAKSEVVYRNKQDADDCLANTRARAERDDTPFRPGQLRGKKVRECADPACVGG